jgi:hypothetical protein
MVENFSWDQEVIRILGQQALKGVITVTVKEILKQVKSSQIKQRLVDFLKSQGLNNYGELIAVDLRSNPRLYSLLQNDAYEKYVRVDEGTGIVFLD